MERELVWRQVYEGIGHISKTFGFGHKGQGHPDVYPTGIILTCWMWACLWREPMAWAMRTLGSPKKRRAFQGLGFSLPHAIPDNSTVSRRMQRPDFWQMLEQLHYHMAQRLLGPDSCRHLIVDSSPLDIPAISHDPDARYGHHGHFGYRLHTLLTQDQIILEQEAWATNQQELAVFPRLVQQAARRGVRCRYLAADIGYDSEGAHQSTLRFLGGMLVAPLNKRGGTPECSRTPLRKTMWHLWQTPAVQAAWKQRPTVERAYSVIKGPLGLDSLPRHIRKLTRVRRFLLAGIILYHAYVSQRNAAHAG